MNSNPDSLPPPTPNGLTLSPSLSTTFKLHPDPNYPQNFPRTVKWCPDGSEFLVQCENRSFQITSTKSLSETPRVFHQPSPIIDFTWYPTASPLNPITHCFIASIRESPVKLFDASDCRLRASYPIIDHRERFIAPHSLAFNLSAQKLYCGFENAIEIFDVGIPGKGTRIHTIPSRKSKDGLKGIISALAFTPSYASDIYAAGSLSPITSNIALFSESQGEVPVMFLGTESESGGFRAGVTQLQFNPTNPNLLYASFRRKERICCWDIRYPEGNPVGVFEPGAPPPFPPSFPPHLPNPPNSPRLPSSAGPPASSTPAVPFHSAEGGGEDEGGDSKKAPSEPSETTNQKRKFDIDCTGRWLAVGSQSGFVSVFDLTSSETPPSVSEDIGQPAGVIRPTITFPAHEDSIGAVSFHPNPPTSTSTPMPLLLSASGSRHFVDDEDEDGSNSEGEEEEDEDEDEDELGEGEGVEMKGRRIPRVWDASIKVWRF